MDKQRRFYLSALGLTVLYYLWLAQGQWSLGFSIINTLYLAWVGLSFKGIRRDKFLQVLWGASLGLGVMMSLRDFGFVKFLTAAGAAGLNILLAAMAKDPKGKISMEKIVKTHLNLTGETLRVLGEIPDRILNSRENYKNKPIKKALVGVILSIPLLAVFGVLFYEADPIFARLINQIQLPRIEVSPEEIWKILSSFVVFGGLTAVAGGKIAGRAGVGKKLTAVTETNVAVLILEVLLAIFSLIQIRYLGASAEDLRQMGIIFSQYTRSGYGQMLIACLLAYGVVLGLEYSLQSQREDSSQKTLTRGLIWIILGEIILFIIAATKRNYIYQSIYGFTEVRLLGFFLSGWLTIMTGLLFYKVLREKGDDFFAKGAVVITAVSILAINWFDIDGTIVKSKPASLDRGVDYRYMAGLSNDAYEGWEKIIYEAEQKIKRKNITTFSEAAEVAQSLDRLNRKYELNKNTAVDNWNWGGNWNYSTMKSLEILKKNIDKITNLERQARELMNDLVERQGNY